MKNNFDILEDTLLSGRNLIEASAGTGKTYSIGLIVIRLLLELEIRLPEILVVTFTNAAAGELKGRIRNFLKEALGLLSGKTPSSGISCIVERAVERKGAGHVRDIIKAALQDLDEASIDTIHGFCLKSLRELALETSSPFEPVILPDDSEYIHMAGADFFRRQFYSGEPEFLEYAVKEKITPGLFEALARLAQKFGKIPVYPVPEDPVPQNRLLHEIRGIYSEIQELWSRSRDEIILLLDENPCLKKVSYNAASIKELADDADRYFAGENFHVGLPRKFNLFTSSGISGCIKKGYEKDGLSHPFFGLSDKFNEKYKDLEKVFSNSVAALEADFLGRAPGMMTGYKDKEMILSFDDLCRVLETALADETRGLAAKLGNLYRAVLIDEFQDTDSMQCRIFQAAFTGKILFFIGDPKQSIYSFRGADLYNYERIISSGFIPPERHFKMNINYRSEEGLVKALNKFFLSRDNPFLSEEISMIEVSAPEPARVKEILTENGASGGNLYFLYQETAAAGKRFLTASGEIRAEESRLLCAEAAAFEALRLLAPGSNILIGDRNIIPSDIAVLVRSGDEALVVKKAFEERGIPAVLSRTDSVYQSIQAEDLYRTLCAVREPHRPDILKAALLTGIFGQTPEEIGALTENQADFESWIRKFTDYRHTWDSGGPGAMFEKIYHENTVRKRLLLNKDGERQVTNLDHIAELLILEGRNKPLSDLIKYLSAKMLSPGIVPEEEEIRLESDDNAALILTIHKSKGLEFPIVFAPYLWEDSSHRIENPFIFHNGRNEPEIALECDENIKGKKKAEDLRESIRLAYVAMTRAVHRTYVAWGRFSGSANSALNYLLHGGRPYKDFPESEALEELKKLQDKYIYIKEMPQDKEGQFHKEPQKDTAPTGKFKKFDSVILPSYRLSSFTSVSQSKAWEGAYFPDRDFFTKENTFPADDDKPYPATLPPGPKTGIALHALFEAMDFTSPPEADEIGLILENSGLTDMSSDCIPAAQDIVKNTLHARLTGKNSETFSLALIKRNDRLSELEFHYPLKPRAGKSLSSEFSLRYGISIDKIPEGFMKGFIDLVFRYNGLFYIADWKSNFLGGSINDYERPILDKTMREHKYNLQYSIYLCALHRYLLKRQPLYDYDKHIGGVFYIFLRGVKSGSDSGIFYDRPEKDWIMNLSEIFCPGESYDR